MLAKIVWFFHDIIKNNHHQQHEVIAIAESFWVLLEFYQVYQN